MTVAIFLGALLGAMALGVPIAYSLLLSGVALMWQQDLLDPQILAQNVVNGADSFPLLAIPFFMLAGEIMNVGGLSRRIVDLALTLVGHRRGGLGFVAILAAVLMAALSGSAVADTAALASLLLPMMVKAGHDKARAGGLIASAGIIAPVIPPSIGFLIFGVVANLSITRLFLAGIVPGIMMGLVLVVSWWFVARRQQVAVSARVPWGRRLRILGRGGWALMLPVIIVGGLRSGIFTPTESAVVAAAYALFVGLVVYRELDAAKIYECLLSTARTTSVVLVLAALAMVAAYMITITDISGQVGTWLQSLSQHPLVLMAAMMLVVFFAGMVLDFIPIVLIFTPVFMPIVKAADIDPVYFGVVFIMNCSIGMITPPVGVVLNVIGSIGKISMAEATRGILPFLGALMALLVLLILFPALVTVPAQWWR